MKRVRHTTLSFQEGNSDKIYEAELIQLSDSEYLVNFRYGKRGTTLREGTKTELPIDYEAANKLFKSLLVSKLNKGYELSAGFDPLADEPARPAVLATPAPANSQDERILSRLRRFAETPVPITSRSNAGLPYIERHSLSRSIQAAGQRRIKAAAGLLPGFITPKEEILNYTIAWALGRIGDPDSLKHLERLETLLPASHRYILPEVRLALTNRSQWLQLILELKKSELEQAEDYRALSAKLADYARYEALETYSLSDKDKSHYQEVVTWRGLENQLLPLIEAIDIDTDWDAFLKRLPEPLNQAVLGDNVIYAQLRDALESLRLHRLHELKQQEMPRYAEDMSIYHHALSQIDLDRVLSSAHARSCARLGLLYGIWGGEKEDLLNALRQTRLFDDFGHFLRRMENSYQRFIAIASKALTSQEHAKARAVLESFGFLAEVQRVFNAVSLETMSQWNFYRQHLNPKLNSLIQGDLGQAVQNLFRHRLDQLKQGQFAERERDRQRFEAGMLELYRACLTDPSLQALFEALLAELTIHHHFPLLRKLYKIAEFRQDFTLLARLQHAFEVTPHISPSSYYKDKTKPFTRRGRDYFRRRIVRTLKQMAELEPAQYTRLAVDVLLPVREDEPAFVARQTVTNRYYRGGDGWRSRRLITDYPPYASHLALNYILRANSRCFILKKGGQAWVAAAGNQPETERPEAHPELWDTAPAELLRLLQGAQAALVNDFALSTLRRQRDYCRNLANPDLFNLLTRPFENTALFAQGYLLERIDEPGVRAALLTSAYASVRRSALESLSAAVLLQDLNLAAGLIVSPHADVRDYLREHLDWLQGHERSLADKALAALLLLGPLGLTGAREFLLQAPLRGQLSRPGLEALTGHALPEFQLLAADLLEASELSYAELEHLLPLLERSPDAAVRAGALRLLGKLPPAEQMAQADILLRALTADEEPLRAAARDLLLNLQQPDFQQRLFARLVDTLFRAQAEGVGEDVLAVVAGFSGIYTGLDKDLIWRLLNARSKLAQQAGSLIVTAFASSAYSIRQLTRLGKHASVAVRQWALAALEQDARTLEQFDVALEILDNPWQDTRTAAIDYFQSLPPDIWTLERTVAVVDQTYDDVERFGRELIGAHFAAGQGEIYLLRLSQHPSRNVQLFVSGFLQAYAADKPELLLSLRPYFITVLTRINQGRVLKDRVLRLLFTAAEQDAAVAKMVAEIVSEQSLTAVINDKSSYIQALYGLMQRHPDLPNPLRVIAPRKAVI